MGVKNLWKLLAPFAASIPVRGKKLAVDTSVWIHQLKGAPEPQLSYAITMRVLKLLFNGITPIFIFDGGVPAAKRKTMEQRRAQRLQTAIHRKCPECGASLGTCPHTINKKMIDELDAGIVDRIKNHNYNWGEMSSSETESSNAEDEEPAVAGRSQSYKKKAEAMDAQDFERLTRTQKLRKLVEMRENRKLPMAYDASSPDAFSQSQIANVKKRNTVFSLIKDLVDDGTKRIQSDWRYYMEYERKNEQSRNREQTAETLEELFDSLSKYKMHKEDKAPAVDQESDSEEDGWCMLYEKRSDKCSDGEKQSLAPENARLPNSFNKLEMPVEKDGSGDAKDTYNAQAHHSLDSEKTGDRKMPNQPLHATGCIHGRSVGDHASMPNYRPIRNSRAAEDAGDKMQADFINDTKPLRGDVSRVQEIIKSILGMLKISCIVSPQESDSQCAFLFRSGIVDGVVTEDNDLIIHGATVYKNFFSKSKAIAVYTHEAVCQGLGLDKVGLVKLSYLLGSDYTPGVRGIGIARALEAVAGVGDEDVAELLKMYEQPRVHRIDGFSNGQPDIKGLCIFLSQSGVAPERIDEVSFLIRRLFRCNTEIDSE